jgi:hypothetical protein
MDINLSALYFERQLLHKKFKVHTPTQVAKTVCGVNAQRGITVYLSFWNRINNFNKNNLDTLLYHKKTLVKTWCMRGTVHVIPSDLFFMYIQAINPVRLIPKNPGIPDEVYTHVINALEKPQTKSEIAEKIQDKINCKTKEVRTMVSRAVRVLGYKGIIVYAQPRGSKFFTRECEFALTENWLPHIPCITQEDAQKQLLLYYLKCYGPATLHDFAYWTGFKMKETRELFQSVNIEEVEIEGNSYYVTPGDSLDGEGGGGIALLPEYDSYVMGHKEKSRILDLQYKSQVFLPLAGVAATMVRDGQVIGTWKMKKDGDTLLFSTHPFELMPEEDMEKIYKHMENIANFMDLNCCITV